MNSRRNDIADPAVETCAWLSQHKVYLEWLEQKHGLLWIKGKPGAGKSTLMRHAVVMIENQKRQANLIVASFFFHGRGSLIQKSPLGLFRSLLHQLLQQIPRLLLLFSSLFEKRCETEGAFGTAWDWKERDLQDFFKHNVTDSARIRLYIDALDECGEENAIKLVDYFDSITSESNVVDASLSICFSCRHYPLVSSDVGLQICVEDEVNQDIEVYIQNVMWRQIRDKSRADEARDEIMSKSHGNFQWVVLVVPRVLQMCKRGRYREIKKIIQAIPSDLGELYKSLLEEVTDDDLPRTLKLMQWICFAQEPLSLEELRIATVVDMNTTYRSIRECQEDEQYADTDEEMARRVVDLSKGLAEVREHNGKQVAQFNHQSVNDYVLDGGLQILEKLPSGSAAGRAHFQLSRSCIRYINMEEIMACWVEPFWGYLYEDRKKLKKDIRGKFPFLRYAVQSWVPHAQGVEKESLSQEDLLSYFQEPSRKLIQHWIDIEGTLDKYDKKSSYSGSTLLHVASRFNLYSVVEALLSLDNINANPKDESSNSPLHHAATNGHEAIVRLLLMRNDIKVNLRDCSRGTPLSYASWNGHETVVRLLLERAEIEADSKDAVGRTPLGLAVEGGHKTVVRLLLERSDVDAGVKDDRDQTPLHIAAERGHETMVRLLLERSNVDANSKDHYGFTPLDNAAQGRHEMVVRMLLEQKDVEADFKDDQDRTPLSYAAGEGDKAETIVELLLKRNDINVNFKDVKGRSPLSYAAEKGNEAKEVARLLLKREDVDVNSKDAKGRTPLSYAASKGDKAETVVRLLLQHNNVEADSKDIKNRTPLSYAVEWADEAEAVVRLLLKRNDVEAVSKDIWNRTPLSYAVTWGNKAETIVKLLLERNDVDADSKDKVNRTPLSYAAQCPLGAERVVRLLLERGNVNANSKDKWGSTPLAYAARPYAEAVVVLLLEREDVDVNSKDWNGQTPLAHAVRHGDCAEAVVRLLLERSDPDMEVKDFWGFTILDHAAKCQQQAENVIRLLQSANDANVAQHLPSSH
jgi:ankyrin repeat protein